MANFFKELFAGERSWWTGARNEDYYARQPQNQPQPAADPVKAAEPNQASAEQKAVDEIKDRQRAIKRNRTVFTTPLGLGFAERSKLMLKKLTGE